jgi:hypothetical protein
MSWLLSRRFRAEWPIVLVKQRHAEVEQDLVDRPLILSLARLFSNPSPFSLENGRLRRSAHTLNTFGSISLIERSVPSRAGPGNTLIDQRHDDGKKGNQQPAVQRGICHRRLLHVDRDRRVSGCPCRNPPPAVRREASLHASRAARGPPRHWRGHEDRRRDRQSSRRCSDYHQTPA